MSDNTKIIIKTIVIVWAIILLVVGYWDPFSKSDSTWWWELLPKIGEIIIVGGIIGFISNESTILNSYRTELTNALVCKNHLMERKDIKIIWENVSKAMFKSKFPKIHSELLKNIQQYLPTTAVSYYDNYVITTRIEHYADKRIKVTDEAEFDLVAESLDKFIFEQDNWVVDNTNFNIEFKIDGNVKTVNSEKKHNKNIHHYVCKVTLKGAKQYHIEKKVTKIYSLQDDNYIGFRAKYITNNFKVIFVIPEDIKLEFTERGTLFDFKEREISKTTLEYSSTGIMLPRQGFIATLSEINQTTQNHENKQLLATA